MSVLLIDCSCSPVQIHRYYRHYLNLDTIKGNLLNCFNIFCVLLEH